MKRTSYRGLLAIIGGCFCLAEAAAQAPLSAADRVAASPLVARSALFGNPDKTQGRLSHDGKYFSFIAPRDGVLNVFLAPANDIGAAKPITQDKKRGIRQHFWAYTNRHIVYVQDEGGDENWHLYVVEVESGAVADLTPFKAIAARVVGLSWRRPNIVAVGINNRQAEWHDLYEIDLLSGARKLIERNEQEFGSYVLDLDLKPRLALRTLPDGQEILRRSGASWASLLKYGTEDSQTTFPLAIESNGRNALMLSSIGRDKSALTRIDLANGKSSVLAASDSADIDAVWLDPRTQAPQAYSVNYLKPEITPLTAAARRDLQVLAKQLGDSVLVVSRTLDDARWIVVSDEAQSPATSYLYERASGTVTKLFSQRPILADAPLVPMQSVEIVARDGLRLVSYLSLPPGTDANGDGRPDSPVPMVLNVHGGPWSRDTYGFYAEHQWLANRGYAVLSVNFRGSTGFGKGFINAGNREWAAKMHDDLLDAVAWAVAEKVTTTAQVGILGAPMGVTPLSLA
jgi:dipeptidyl aminopeptidase/acylaminoacyl peptidase